LPDVNCVLNVQKINIKGEKKLKNRVRFYVLSKKFASQSFNGNITNDGLFFDLKREKFRSKYIIHFQLSPNFQTRHCNRTHHRFIIEEGDVLIFFL